MLLLYDQNFGKAGCLQEFAPQRLYYRPFYSRTIAPWLSSLEIILMYFLTIPIAFGTKIAYRCHSSFTLIRCSPSPVIFSTHLLPRCTKSNWETRESITDWKSCRHFPLFFGLKLLCESTLDFTILIQPWQLGTPTISIVGLDCVAVTGDFHAHKTRPSPLYVFFMVLPPPIFIRGNHFPVVLIIIRAI